MQETLYHFTCTKYALEGIQKRRVKASELDNTNDLFESLSYRSGSVDGMQTQEFFRWRTDCRVLCLSKTYKNPLLWGHYADKGKGVCLGFNVIVDEVDCFPVDYQPARVESGYEPSGIGFIAPLLNPEVKSGLIKYRDWKYEEEWRMWGNIDDNLTFDPINDRYFFPFENRLTLREILIGPRCEEKNLRRRLEELTANYPETRPDIIFTRLSLSTFEIEKVS